jgi:aminoglycoside N3'-acetyltransferase|tara:strand:+ start:920 stop:1711 length:792 start_codon:yes stop_codon:yes gene_type:complete
MIYSYRDIISSLKEANIKRGDSIFLTTSLGMCGQVKGVLNLNDLNKLYFEAITSVIGENGTIVVPTYSYSFSENQKTSIFDLQKTESKIGSFANFFLKQEDVCRSIDPMISVAIFGKKNKLLLRNLPFNSYGKDCIFERMLSYNFKCCNIGLDLNWIPFLHYADWVNNCPFRFNKFFKGVIIDAGIKKEVKWDYYCRILRDETIANGHKIKDKANKSNLFTNAKLGRAAIYVIDYTDYYRFVIEVIKSDPWITVNGPKFNTSL